MFEAGLDNLPYRWSDSTSLTQLLWNLLMVTFCGVRSRSAIGSGLKEADDLKAGEPLSDRLILGFFKSSLSISSSTHYHYQWFVI